MSASGAGIGTIIIIHNTTRVQNQQTHMDQIRLRTVSQESTVELSGVAIQITAAFQQDFFMRRITLMRASVSV